MNEDLKPGETEIPQPPVSTPEDPQTIQAEPVETVEPVLDGDPAFPAEELDEKTSKDATPMEVDVAGVDSTDDVTVTND